MTDITLCPKCKEAELNFEGERDTADDGVFFSAGFIADDRLCDCPLTAEEIERLEEEAAEKFAESYYAEPDFDLMMGL